MSNATVHNPNGKVQVNGHLNPDFLAEVQLPQGIKLKVPQTVTKAKEDAHLTLHIRVTDENVKLAMMAKFYLLIIAMVLMASLCAIFLLYL